MKKLLSFLAAVFVWSSAVSMPPAVLFSTVPNPSPFTDFYSTLFTQSGSTQYIDMGNVLDWNGSARTSCEWAKPVGVAYGPLMAKGYHDGTGWLFFTGSGNNFAVDAPSSGGGRLTFYAVTSSFVDGNWHQFCWVTTGKAVANQALYFDGVAQTVINAGDTLTGSLANSHNFQIGDDEDGDHYHGNLDEASVWNIAFNQAQITEIYNAGSPGDLSTHSQTAHLIGWWRMGDSPDSTSSYKDASVSGFDGTPHNIASADIALDVAHSMTITSPSSHQVFQRSGTSATVAIAGASSVLSFDTVKARAVPRSGFAGTDTGWVTIYTHTAGTGSFSGTLPIAQGWYDVQLQTLRRGHVVEYPEVKKVGGGERFIVAGQSLVTNTTPTPATPANEMSSKVALDGTWSAATDPQPSATETGGSFIPSFADQLATAINLPVAVLDIGYSGTALAVWLPSAGPTYLYHVRVLPAIQLLGTFRGFIWEQGQADALAGTTAPQYVSRLETIIDQTRVDAGFAAPWLIAKSTWQASAVDATIQGAQVTVQGYTGCFAGSDSDSLGATYRQSDLVHFTDAGAISQATLWKNAVVTAFGW